jgi:hypothetical protein
MADLASIAAATGAGYKEIVIQKSANLFQVILEKTLAGDSKHNIHVSRAYGEGTTQANAETAALAALNSVRDERQRKTSGTIDVT